MRLNNSVHDRRWRKTRLEVLRRDGWRCFYGGGQLVAGVNATVDHRIRREDGGTNDKANLVACCSRHQNRLERNAPCDGRVFKNEKGAATPPVANLHTRSRLSLGPLLVRGGRRKHRAGGDEC